MHPLRLICTSIARPQSPTYYDDLGLTPKASSDEIKKAFIELSKKHHPDINPEDPESHERFQRISEANSVLGNPRLRKSYDKGALGRLTSVADREAKAHKFDGDEFVEARGSFKRQYSKARENQDKWTRGVSSKAFWAKQRSAASNAQRGSYSSSSSSSAEYKPRPQTGGGGLFGTFLVFFVFSFVFALYKVIQ